MNVKQVFIPAAVLLMTVLTAAGTTMYGCARAPRVEFPGDRHFKIGNK
jgi:hypothetical protein